MQNPFHKPTTPKNSLQLLQWLIFEPVLLERYEKTLSKIQTVFIVLKAIFVNFFVVIIPLTLGLYAISVIIIAAFDLPLIFPPENKVFVQQWATYSTWWEKAYFFASFENYQSLKELIFGLAVGLAVGFVFGLALSLTGDLKEGIVISLGLGSGLGLAYSVAIVGNFTWAFIGSLTFGFANGFVGDLSRGLKVSLLGFGLPGIVMFDFVGGLALGLVVLLFFYLSYFRLWFYPWHFLKSLVNVSLTNNPYISDGIIWLPIWGMTDKLTRQAQQDPTTSLAFVNFLLEYRPLQKQLAMHIAHAATAGHWQHHPLQKAIATVPDSRNAALNALKNLA